MQKSANLYLFTFFIWIIVSAVADKQLYSLLNYDKATLKLLWIICIAILNYFWLFSCYHVSSYLFSLFYQPQHKNSNTLRIFNSCPHVAILYTTKNDFLPLCVESCIHLDYLNCHTFICDDSNDQSIERIIDQFSEKHRNRCSIIRRDNNVGFKAGNLNNALRLIHPQYKYIVIADHDSALPSNFIQASLKYFQDNRNLAFVQAIHQGEICYRSAFSRDLALGVDCLWEYLNLKNRFGLTSCFGHGVFIDRQVINEVGGFPEIISEDLGFTALVRDKGYIGIVAKELVCGEGIPANLNQFRRRYEKWLIGILEFSQNFLVRFISNKKISYAEKIDLLFQSLSLINSIPLFFFILLINVFIPSYFGKHEILTIESELFGFAYNFDIIATNHLFTYTNTEFIRIIVVFSIVSPLLYFLKYFRVEPIKTLRYIFVSFVCFCSIVIPNTISTILFLIKKKYSYRSTGDYKEDRLFDCSGAWYFNFQVGKILSVSIEVFLYAILLFFGIKTVNLFLLSFALAGLFGPILIFGKWDNKLISFFKYIPFVFLLLQLIVISMSILGYAGVFSQIFIIHF